jgi:biopolymer transport protein ExbD
MLKKRKRRIGVKIDMTPMVDIAFLLLIFYMTTTTFKPPEKRSVNLPVSHSEIKLPDANMMTITISKEDSVFVEYVVKKKQVIEKKELEIPERVYEEASLGSLVSVINSIRVSVPGAYSWFLVIKADKDVTFGTMSQIMDAMQSMDIIKFNLVTEMEMEKAG